MSATTGLKRREHSGIFAPRNMLRCVLAAAALGCMHDDAVPDESGLEANPSPAEQVPIVDMSPSAQRPLLPGAASVVAPKPAAVPVARPVPERGASPVLASDIALLRARGLIVPVAGIARASLAGSFLDQRGSRVHEAMDIAAPRGTPVLSVEAGTVLKLFTSRGGGLTIYVADPSKRFIYYYAHLDAYAPGLAEGEAIVKGQQIGTVGTTGNAPPNTPHLHFAILRNDDMSRWWTGTPLDPFPILRAGTP